MSEFNLPTIIYIVGRLPPPLGGVSSFVSRRASHLIAKGFHVVVVEPRPLRLIAGLVAARWRGAEFIEVNTLRLEALVLLAVTGNLRKAILYDHNHSRQFAQLSSLHRAVTSYLIGRSGRLRLVSEHLRAHYCQFGVKMPADVDVVSPFLPPPVTSAAAVAATYPTALRKFVSDRHPLLITSVWRVTLYSKDDVYRMDMCLALVERLRRLYPNIGLIVGIGDGASADGANSLDRTIHSRGLELAVYVAKGAIELWPLMTEADVFVRPTVTDGASVSVMEALYLGCSVVASDAVPRPDGVILFQTNNLDSFEAAVISILGDPKRWTEVREIQ